MSVRVVSKIGDPVLRQVARELSAEEIGSRELRQLVEDMIDTMHAEEGIGIAAPQIGVSVQAAVVEIDESSRRYPGMGALAVTVFLNPRVVVLDEAEQSYWEGCLSVPDLRGQVPRFHRLRLEALDRHGRPFAVEAAGFFARVIQHECDHLDGRVYLDRMRDMRSLCFLSEFERFVLNQHGEEA